MRRGETRRAERRDSRRGVAGARRSSSQVKRSNTADSLWPLATVPSKSQPDQTGHRICSKSPRFTNGIPTTLNPIHTEHLPLFEAPALSKQGAPETSRKAADNMLVRVAGLRGAALSLIRASVDGMTADEVALALGITGYSARPRVSELYKPPFEAKWPQLIKDSGRRRPNESGDMAVVWVALSEEEVAANQRAKSDAAA